jgi:hypothetical protein
MLPHAAMPWLVDMRGRHIDADLYDIATWRDRQWSLFDPTIAQRTIATHGGGAAGARYLDVLREFMAYNLGRGRRFTGSFCNWPDPPGMPTWVFGGDCEPTLARLVVEDVHGWLHARERVDDILVPVPGVDYQALMHEPGDTVVTRASLLGRRTLDIAAPRAAEESLRIAHAMFLCESHQQLMGNPTQLDNLLHALLSDDAG